MNAIPQKLTRNHLFLSTPHDSKVLVSDIQSLTSDYHEGSPVLCMSVAGQSLTLLTSARDQLRRAILSIRPDLETTP